MMIVLLRFIKCGKSPNWSRSCLSFTRIYDVRVTTQWRLVKIPSFETKHDQYQCKAKEAQCQLSLIEKFQLFEKDYICFSKFLVS